MLSYIEFLGIPISIAIIIVIIFFAMQFIGEILEFKGKIVPEIFKIRKYFARRKKEKAAISKMTDILEEYQQMSTTIENVNQLLTDIDKHYSKDNIAKRDGWMQEVNEHISDSEKRRKEQDDLMRELNKKLDENNEVTLSILIENKRMTIINFASKIIDENYPATREQFNRIFKTHKEYEEIIEKHGLTNGEVNIAIHIIQEQYEIRMKNHSFIEDVRGYNV